MQPRTRAYLFDIAHAASGIATFLQGKTVDDYRNDLLLRAAVERQFIIIGEAMMRLRTDDPATAQRINEYSGIIRFRNVLVHGYDHIDDHTTWRIIQEKLPVLASDVENLLRE